MQIVVSHYRCLPILGRCAEQHSQARFLSARHTCSGGQRALQKQEGSLYSISRLKTSRARFAIESIATAIFLSLTLVALDPKHRLSDPYRSRALWNRLRLLRGSTRTSRRSFSTCSALTSLTTSLRLHRTHCRWLRHALPLHRHLATCRRPRWSPCSTLGTPNS